MTWQQVRKQALTRDGYQCQRCSRPATDVHHRVVKGMGGAAVEITYGLANLVSLCRTCHAHVHAHPEQSYEYGWLLHSWKDPTMFPVNHEQKYEF